MKQVNERGCYFSLAFSAFSFFIACGSLISFYPSDRISFQRGAILTSLGFVYFVSLTDFFNKFLLETSNGLKIRKKFRLRLSDVLDITNKLVSAVQALLSSLAGAIVCRYSCTISFLHASHFISEAYAYFGAAYFIFDIWSMYKVHAASTAQKITDKLKSVTGTNKDKLKYGNGRLYDKQQEQQQQNFDTTNENNNKKNGNLKNEKYLSDYENSSVTTTGKDFAKYMINNPIMMIHHIFVGSIGLAVIAYLRGGLGDCIFSYIYMMEISTPFVSLRSILSRMNLKTSRFYIVNGLTMLATFFVFRVLMLPYLFYYYSQVANVTYFQGILSLPRGCKIGIVILFFPQYYWFYLMVTGAMKTFFPKKQKECKQDNGIDVNNKTNEITSLIDNKYNLTENTAKNKL